MPILLQKSNQPAIKTYPLIPLRDGVMFPQTENLLVFGRPRSTAAIDAALKNDQHVIIVSQKDPNNINPGKKDLYSVGTLCKIERTLKTNNEIHAIVHGVNRVNVVAIIQVDPFLKAETQDLIEITEKSEEIEALSKHLTSLFKKAVNLGKSVEVANFMRLMAGVEPSELADQIATTLDIPVPRKQLLLENVELKKRLIELNRLLAHEVKVLEIERRIASKTQKKFDRSMREAVLRERMKTIQKELGVAGQEEDKEIKDLRKKIILAKMPREARKKSLKELKRLASMSPQNPETSYIRTWLETMVEMPWAKTSPNNVSIKHAEKVLAADHYGLEEVKERIIEYLSVMKLKKNQTLSLRAKLKGQKKTPPVTNPTILCFVGAPGVGKTSIGRSIAKALGRKFVKISLGGIRDEAEIRGHRRTYVGAMPGRIIQGTRSTGTKNPVFMLDEIDKVGADFRGDPSAALLEALDPEQNNQFSDHYLEVSFDLSQVIFITTANILDTIPPALKDRLEVIHFSGYTEEEKFNIAKRHLIEKTLKNNGLAQKQIQFDDATLKKIIKLYTREAGVRNLEREISKIFRKAAKKIATGYQKSLNISSRNLAAYLGPAKYSETYVEAKDDIGIATGLAWTQAGGDIIFIEVALMPGKGHLNLTGKLGDVMKESGQAALSYIRSRWQALKLKKEFYKNKDVHIHIPEGAVPKDGPSAGITIATALVSALTKRPTNRLVGMTGEITLRGRVLEIGGVKEKVIAAHRAGLKEVILPKNNKKDLVKVPTHVKKDLKFHFVSHLDDVLKIALKK